ncbi:hypothetical protein AMTRI_Chr12g270970 [Amborella trichopoda]
MLVEGIASIEENLLEIVPSDLVSCHGKIFSTHDGSYEFYKNFVKAWGDSNRTTIRYYVFHGVGHLTNKEFSENKGERDRSSRRCNCVHMSIAKVMDSDISYWHVVTFDNLHNHDLLEPQEVRFLPIYCSILESYKHCILQFAKDSTCVRDMMRLYEIDRGLKPGELPFIDKDIYNFVCAMNNANRNNDAHILLTICKQMKDKDFKYDFIVGEDNRLEHNLYNIESIEEFEKGWHALVNKFALYSNIHINNLWNLKEFWALPYLRSHFFFGMKTIGRSKSINAFVKRFLDSQTPLNIRTMCPFEDYATRVLTNVFSKLQEEIISSFQYLTSPKDDCTLFRERKSSSTSGTYVERVQTIQSLASTIGTKSARFDDCYKFIMK